MQDQVNHLIAQQQNQHEQFSCAASLGGSFTFEEETKQNDHGPQLRSDSNAEQSKPPAKSTETQSKPPAESQSKSKISKNKKKTSPKPRRSETSEEQNRKVTYYSTFQERKRSEPAAVNVGANAGLKNSNVVCYSNAILQCLASCFCLSDFSPSENRPELELNRLFACLMSSMVKGGQSIDPSSFMNIFRPLFQPPAEEEGGVNADEQEGMYYDFA
jgi:hypothetical protein